MASIYTNHNSSPQRRGLALRWASVVVAVLLGTYVLSRWLVSSGVWSPSDNAVIATDYAMAPISRAPVFDKPAGPAVKLTRSPYIQWTTQTSAVIVWDTDRLSNSLAEITPVAAPGAAAQRAATQRFTITQKNPVTRHIVRPTGLRSATAYRYRVGSNGRVLASGQFSTAKPAGQAFSFAVWGDSGMRSRAQFALARRIEAARPDFLLHTGDLIYPSGAAADYNPKFFDVYKTLLARAPFYGSLGNHDALSRKGQPFLLNFVLPANGPEGVAPKRNYSFDYADAHVVVLDSNAPTAQLQRLIVPWLRRDMTRSRARWKFVVFHHPPFSSGLHGDDARMQRVLVPVLRDLKVDIVFNGHDHAYERWKPRDGVTYIVTGAGGAGLYRRRRVDPMTVRFRNDVHSFTRVDIAGTTLRLRQIATDGSILDDWRLNKR